MGIWREDMGRIVLSVNGTTGVWGTTGTNFMDTVSWNTMEGGEITPEMTGYNPGGMQPYVNVGGLRKRSDITITRAWDNFLIAYYIGLDTLSGITPARVSFQPMSADRRTPQGTPITYSGVLGPVTRPGYNSSSSSIAYLQVVIGAHEAVS